MASSFLAEWTIPLPLLLHKLQNHVGSYHSPKREQIAVHCLKGSQRKLPHISFKSKRGIYIGPSSHNENEAPHFHLLMEFDSSRCPTCAIGIERAFIQHEDLSITRLNFSWEAGEAENMGSSTYGSVVFTNYPTKCNG